MMTVTDGTIEARLSDALIALKYARADGDTLKIALAEDALNDLIDRHSCHGCHGSLPERTPPCSNESG
jgi:hypothetical protein